ncbi:hypothetical protein Syun_030733 [Stephania yunnanensis]|uniref:Uncharacterized protein n=1 Tax=Stephania yunnanensis TaxID=152371 RepID=A0AAP0DVP5_9MAGN
MKKTATRREDEEDGGRESEDEEEELADVVAIEELADVVAIEELADVVAIDELADVVAIEELADVWSPLKNSRMWNRKETTKGPVTKPDAPSLKNLATRKLAMEFFVANPVEAEIVQIEADDVPVAISNEVTKSQISMLVIGASSVDSCDTVNSSQVSTMERKYSARNLVNS